MVTIETRRVVPFGAVTLTHRVAHRHRYIHVLHDDARHLLHVLSPRPRSPRFRPRSFLRAHGCGLGSADDLVPNESSRTFQTEPYTFHATTGLLMAITFAETKMLRVLRCYGGKKLVVMKDHGPVDVGNVLLPPEFVRNSVARWYRCV